MNKVLVLGGTGFIGRHVCEKLHRRGWHITVPTRQIAKAAAVQHLPRVDVVEANVHEPRQLLRLLDGQQAVVNLVGILHGREDDFDRVHVELPLSLAEACLADAACRLVHLSALGAALDGPSMYQRSKARGEEVLRATGLALTILRPSVVFGAGDHFLNLFAQLQAVLPALALAGADSRLQPVWVEDLANAVAACLEDDATGRASVGQTFECAGPEVLSLRELVQLAGRHGSTQRPVIALPWALGRVQAALMECLPGEPLLSRDNLDSLRVPNVATGQWPGLERLGIVPASVHSIAPAYLGARAARSRLLQWRKAARR